MSETFYAFFHRLFIVCSSSVHRLFIVYSSHHHIALATNYFLPKSAGISPHSGVFHL